MQRAQLIPLGAGVIASLLHLSVTLGTPGAFMLAYFAQAPIVATGLALGFMPATVAAAIAAVLVTVGSPGVGALSLFILTSVLPVLLIVYFAVQSRDRDEEGTNGGVEFYPVGRLLGWLTALALLAFIVAYLIFLGVENGVRGAIETYLRNVLAVLPGAQASATIADHLIMTMAAVFPAIAVGSWLLMIVVNGVLAQKFLTASGKNMRPSPVYRNIEAPLWPLGVIVLGALLCISGGNSVFLGINVMLIATIPFFFIGLAVLHSISGAWAGRPFLLVGVYLSLVLLVWPAAIIALLGLLEHWVRLRKRMQTGRSNKGNE